VNQPCLVGVALHEPDGCLRDCWQRLLAVLVGHLEQFHISETSHDACDRLTTLVQRHARRILDEEYWRDDHLEMRLLSTPCYGR
jgi:hypothetical protein